MAENNYALDCDSIRKNTGFSELCPDIGAIVGYIVCPYNYSIATAEAAKLEATYTAAIQAEKANRIYPFPSIFQMEDSSEETVFQEGAISNIFVRDGKINWMMTHESGRYKHAALKSHTRQKVSIILIDQQGRLHGTSDDGVVFEAINMELFVVEKLTINDGTNGTTTKVSMIFADSNKFQLKPAVVVPEFTAKDLEGLFDVALTDAGGSTTSDINVKAQIKNTTEPIFVSDVVGEDWSVKDASGVEQTITTITDNEDGTWSFNFGTPLAAGDYDVNLLASQNMTTEGYESLGAVTITVA